MPLTLAKRIGPDTLGKIELAAESRYAEARHLLPQYPLGALYLFGYSIEIRLKVAYYRVIGLVPNSELAGPRALAEKEIRRLLNKTGAVGHDLTLQRYVSLRIDRSRERLAA